MTTATTATTATSKGGDLADERALREGLAQIVHERRGGQPAIDGVHRRPAGDATSYSYACEVVTVQLANGDAFEAFLKDFAVSRLPKDGIRQRRERELRVYRDLLAEAHLGTPEYYGSVWEEADSRFWLLLEFVPGRRFHSRDLDSWIAAARWPGRLQGYFAPHTERLRACGFLLRHDASFFRSKADLALRAVTHFSPSLAARLERVVSRYDGLVDIMASQPRTLVHGSYRKENILVDSRADPPRVCPVDWELAGFGAPLYDLAFISDGAEPLTLDRLCEAYREEAKAWHLAVPDRAEMRYVVECFRLHKVMKALSESVEWSFRESSVAKYVEQAEQRSRFLLESTTGA